MMRDDALRLWSLIRVRRDVGHHFAELYWKLVGYTFDVDIFVIIADTNCIAAVNPHYRLQQYQNEQLNQTV